MRTAARASAVIVCAALSGCRLFGPHVDPLVGTWQEEDSSVPPATTVTLSIGGDGGFVISEDIAGTVLTISGVIDEDPGAGTVTVTILSGAPIQAFTDAYALSPDAGTLWITLPSGVVQEFSRTG